MQRFALLLGLLALTVTLGWLWNTEDSSPPLRVAATNIEQVQELEILMAAGPESEQAEVIRRLKSDSPEPNAPWIILTREESERLREVRSRATGRRPLEPDMMYQLLPDEKARIRRQLDEREPWDLRWNEKPRRR